MRCSAAWNRTHQLAGYEKCCSVTFHSPQQELNSSGRRQCWRARVTLSIALDLRCNTPASGSRAALALMANTSLMAVLAMHSSSASRSIYARSQSPRQTPTQRSSTETMENLLLMPKRSREQLAWQRCSTRKSSASALARRTRRAWDGSAITGLFQRNEARCIGAMLIPSAHVAHRTQSIFISFGPYVDPHFTMPRGQQHRLRRAG